jgi:hypothetical protein
VANVIAKPNRKNASRRKGIITPASLTQTIHEYLLRRPIPSPGGAFLVRPPRRTASTPTSALLARSPASFGLERLETAFMNNPG